MSMFEISVFTETEEERQTFKRLLIDHCQKNKLRAVYFQNPSYDDLQFYVNPKDSGIVPAPSITRSSTPDDQ